MPKAIRDNGLTLALLLLFIMSLAGQSLAGLAKYNEDQHDHGRPGVTYTEYIVSSAFVESVFENWESEFLQMALYVWLTSFLYQRGSAESKDPDEPGVRRLMRNRRTIGPIPRPPVLFVSEG